MRCHPQGIECQGSGDETEAHHVCAEVVNAEPPAKLTVAPPTRDELNVLSLIAKALAKLERHDLLSRHDSRATHNSDTGHRI
jgi:hypothetical protein